MKDDNIPNNMMSDFSFDRASDWDLQAIVKGKSLSNNTNNIMKNIPFSYDAAWFKSLLGIEDHQGYENTPFVFNNNEPQRSHESSSTSSPRKIVESSTMNFDSYAKSPGNEPKQKVDDADSCVNTRPATISKRRKNKHKIIKMVQQTGGDRVLSDKWNWRKYGEKAIKGSPYPRSYYRCSYPGGCSARKQVEQSGNDPSLFLITYMEEHAHPYPTRRHSQAGRSAKRFNHPSCTKVIITNEPQNTLVRTMTLDSSTNNNHEYQNFGFRGDGDDVGSEGKYVGEDHQGVCFGKRVFEDDFFAGLDYLEGLCMNLCN